MSRKSRVLAAGGGESVTPLGMAVERAERAAIAAALQACGNNLSQAARSLEIDRNTLKRKLKR